MTCEEEWGLDGEPQGPFGPSLLPSSQGMSESDLSIDIYLQISVYVHPTMSIALSQYVFHTGETGIATFTFSEAPAEFTLANITSPNGVLSALGVTGNPLIYTAVFTPNSGISDAVNVITVDALWKNAMGVYPTGSTVSANYEIDTSYFLNDEFTTDDAAPLSLPRTCEPGPGVLSLSAGGDPNSLSISGGVLKFAGAAAVTTLSYPAASAVGDAAKLEGIALLPGGSQGTVELFGTGYLLAAPWVSGIYAPGRNYLFQSYPPPHTVAFIRVATGRVMCLVYSSGVWAVLGFNGSTTANYAFGQYSDKVNSLNSFARVSSFHLASVSENSLAISATAVPVSGSTGTMTNPGIVEFTWIPAAAEVLDWRVRIEDADNCWIVRCNQAGGTIKIVERTAGVETERASAAVVWAVGAAKLLEVWCEGDTITVYIATGAGIAYTSAVHNTGTGIQVTGFATGQNLRSWPKTLSDPLASYLTAI